MLAVIRIWGLINSGTRWIQAFRGGSKVVIPMPDSIVLDITGPRSIRASRGSSMLAQLSGGRIIMPHTNVLYSRWIAQRTASFQNDIMGAHIASRSGADEAWATVSQNVISGLYEQVIKRLISSIRNMKHGGTIIILPHSLTIVVRNFAFAETDALGRLSEAHHAVSKQSEAGEFVLEISSPDGIVIPRTWQVKPRFFVTHRREKEGRRREEGARLRQGRETS